MSDKKVHTQDRLKRKDDTCDDVYINQSLSNIDAALLHEQVMSNSLADMESFAELENLQGTADKCLDNKQVNATNVETALDSNQIELFNLALNDATSLQSIRDFIRFCVTQLRNYDVVIAQGSTDDFAEAAAIVLHTLNLDWSADEQILDCRLTDTEKTEVLELLRQRIIYRQPLSYLINLAYFCDLPFYVDERVLIPRSPIAELIRQQFYPYFEVNQFAQPLADKHKDNIGANNHGLFYQHGLEDKQLAQPQNILDLCTGSGCIAVAIAKRFPQAHIDATDIDQDALEVACVNIEHHDLNYQVNAIESDLFDKLPADMHYELIVTNPPYVDAAAMADLPPEFLYEPELALAAGQDGLDLVHIILYRAADYLTQDGLLICEVGDSEWALRQAYPNIQFNWLTFAFGGSGVFAIDRESLLQFRSVFAAYVAKANAYN